MSSLQDEFEREKRLQSQREKQAAIGGFFAVFFTLLGFAALRGFLFENFFGWTLLAALAFIPAILGCLMFSGLGLLDFKEIKWWHYPASLIGLAVLGMFLKGLFGWN